MTELGAPNVDDLMDMDSLTWEMTLISSRRSEAVEFNSIVASISVLYNTDNGDIEHDPLALGTTKGDQMFEAGSVQGFPLPGDEDNDVPMSEEKHGDDRDDDDEDDDRQGSDRDIDMREDRRSNRLSDDSSSDVTYDNYEQKMIAKRSKEW